MLKQLIEPAAALLVLAAPLSCQGAPGTSARTASAVDGSWKLNPGRSHYGPGVERRLDERMECASAGQRIQCVVRSRRADGAELVARFSATVDGPPAAVTGIPDVDAVQLRRPQPSLIDATFLSRGSPAFGYRAMQSDDGKSLMIITVDPVSRVAQTTVVVYDRR